MLITQLDPLLSTGTQSKTIKFIITYMLMIACVGITLVLV